MEDWLLGYGVQLEGVEEVFRNGYAFGELLFKIGLLDNFGQFVNKDQHADANLHKIQMALSIIDVNVIPERIKAADRQYLIKLLQKLYRLIDLTLKQSQQKSRKKKTPTKTQQTRPGVDKFTAERERQAKKAEDDHKLRQQQLYQQKMGDRQKHLDTIRENRQFMQQWDQEVQKKWQATQTRQRNLDQTAHNLKVKLATDFKNRQLKYIDDNAVDAIEGIDEFERNMVRLGIDHVSDETGATKKKKQNLKTEAAVTMSRIKENKVKNDQAAKDREARQRKIYVDQVKSRRIGGVKEGGNALERKMQHIFNKSRLIGFSGIRRYVQKYQEYQQSLVKLEEYKQKQQQDFQRLQTEREAQFGQIEKERRQNMHSTKYNLRMMIINEMKAKHKKSADNCKHIVDLLLDIVECAVDELVDNETIHETIWQEWINKFKEGTSVLNESEI